MLLDELPDELLLLEPLDELDVLELDPFEELDVLDGIREDLRPKPQTAQSVNVGSVPNN